MTRAARGESERRAPLALAVRACSVSFALSPRFFAPLVARYSARATPAGPPPRAGGARTTSEHTRRTQHAARRARRVGSPSASGGARAPRALLSSLVASVSSLLAARRSARAAPSGPPRRGEGARSLRTGTRFMLRAPHPAVRSGAVALAHLPRRALKVPSRGGSALRSRLAVAFNDARPP